MAVGLLIDTFLIRPVLTPAVLTLLGPAASWPSRRIRTHLGPADPGTSSDRAPDQAEVPMEVPSR